MGGKAGRFSASGDSFGGQRLPNGRALTGQSHDYKRHGTTTLFAPLEVATGKIIAAFPDGPARPGDGLQSASSDPAAERCLLASAAIRAFC
jgi:hypothetical protein